MFDRLLLLERGGRTLYFGDIGRSASILIDYFQRHGARDYCVHQNPAEWILVVTGAYSLSAGPINWSEEWQNSPKRHQVKLALMETKTEWSDESNTFFSQQDTEFAASWLSQFFYVTNRLFQEYWRDPVYLYSKAALTVGVVSLGKGFLHYTLILNLIR
jgi:ATP-binding cassette, subfamily G (WHITE), member 2, PDR